MYSTVKGGFQVADPCPASHPVRMPQVAYETMWNTTMFNDKSLWPEDGSQPFVWSTGDTKGYSTHADYLFGWEGDSLQRAMDAPCFFQRCSVKHPEGVLKIQTPEEQNACKIPLTVKENVDGCEFASAPVPHCWGRARTNLASVQGSTHFPAKRSCGRSLDQNRGQHLMGKALPECSAPRNTPHATEADVTSHKSLNLGIYLILSYLQTRCGLSSVIDHGLPWTLHFSNCIWAQRSRGGMCSTRPRRLLAAWQAAVTEARRVGPS